MQLQLIATAAFGLEAVVVREIKALGYAASVVRPGRVAFVADAAGLCRANLWLRSADRVLVELARFPAADFDALFDTTQALPWEDWVAPNSALPVRGRSHKSQLTSVPAIQRTVKKALADRLIAKLRKELPESGPPVPVEVSLMENEATIDLDASGDGLHRRGYRKLAAAAQLRETLAAALVQLSFWKPGRPLIDPFCGTGTIVIEAAMIGRRLAPGRCRTFAAEQWPAIRRQTWQEAREEAADAALGVLEERIIGWDADPESIKLARYHAEQAGVNDDIHFQQRGFDDLSSKRQYGCLITNPPYGERMGSEREIAELYQSMPLKFRQLKTWSHYILTARSDFESLVGQKADRRRKLYNGRLTCTYYQYHGPRPPRDDMPQDAESTPAFGGLQPSATRQTEEFANRLRKTSRHFRRWPARRGIYCFRLYDRDIPEIPLAIDRYGDALHIAEYERPHDRTAAEHADWLDALAAVACITLDIPKDQVFLKKRQRQRGSAQYGRVARQCVEQVVEEAGLKFRVNLSDFLDTGLFLDHRVTRGMVRDEADGRRFLNLFGYTGAFTVYAAAGGASATTTVDQSARYLQWAEENLRLNNLDDQRHKFVAEEALGFLESLPGDELFSLAVVDPPTFSNRKGLERDWDVQRDHVELLARVAGHMTPGGVVYFSTNFRRFKFDESALTQFTIREISRQTVPEDFRNKRIHRCWRLVTKN